MTRAINGSASHNPAQDTIKKQPDDAQKPGQNRPAAFPGDGILGPLQSLRQLQPRDIVRLSPWL